MSRSKDKGKPPGYDFWSARPGNKGGGGSGRVVKKITHSKERAMQAAETKKIMKDKLDD